MFRFHLGPLSTLSAGLALVLSLAGPALAQKGPSPHQLLELPSKAESHQKRAIPVYRFGQGSAETIFLFAAFHGDERQGVYMLEQLMKELAAKPQYYANKTIFCVPLVNPDGYQANSRTNGRKVDLNRNFPTRDYKPNLNAGTRYYAGAQALSEPESRLVYELIKPYLNGDKKNLKILSIHGPLAVVNYDGPALDLAKALSAQSKLPISGSIGYATPGSFGTFYGKEHGIPVITFETGYESPEKAWARYRTTLLALLQYPNPQLEPSALPSEAPSPLPSPLPSKPPSPVPSQAPFPTASPTVGPTASPAISPLPQATPTLISLASRELSPLNPLPAPKRRWWLLGPTPSPLPTPEPTPEPTPSTIILATPTPRATPIPTPVPTPLPTATPYQPGRLSLPKSLSKQAYIRVSKKTQLLQVIDQNRIVVSVPVSTGLGSKDTPEGTFRIISKVPFPSYYGSPHLGRRSYPSKHPNNPLGTRWMQLNVGHFKTGVAIGLHGTDEPNLVGKAISGGCVRMHNGDVEQLFQIFKVGMKVIISAK